MTYKSFTNPAFILAFTLLMVGAVGMGAAVKYYKLTLRKEPIYPKDGRLLTAIPKETRSWKCSNPDKREDEETEKVLGTKNYISRMYIKKDTPAGHDVALELHSAYYTGMIDTVPHVPDRCFVAAGMQLGTLTQDLPLPLNTENMIPDRTVPKDRQDRVFTVRSADGRHPRLPLDPKSIKLHTMKFVNEKGKDLYGGYFFIANGGCVPRAEDVRLLAFDLHSTYAYYLKVQFTSHTVTSQEELAVEAASLLDELFGEVMLCTPDWIEVEAGNYPPPTTDTPPAPAGHAK